MNGIATLVPGFDAAVRGRPEAAEALRTLDASLENACLSRATQARIGLAVAQVLGVDYAIWAMERLAQRCGLSGEDLVLARMGLALDPRERAVTRMVRCMLVDGLRDERTPAGHALTNADVSEIRGHVARAVLTCFLLQDIAPRVGVREASR